MVARWQRSIDSAQDVLDFQEHIWAVNRKRDPWEFPFRIDVSGEAYGPVKEKIELDVRREKGVLKDALLGLATLPFGGSPVVFALKSVARQVFGYGVEAYGDRNNRVRKAAATIACCYRIAEDSGNRLVLSHYDYNDPLDGWQRFPETY